MRCPNEGLASSSGTWRQKPQLSSDDLAERAMAVACKSIAADLGFTHFNLGALDTITAVSVHYMERMCTLLKQFTDHANRTVPTLRDAALAYDKMQVDEDQLVEYMERSAPLSFFTKPIELPALGFTGTEDKVEETETEQPPNLQPGQKQITLPSNIPDWVPPLYEAPKVSLPKKPKVAPLVDDFPDFLNSDIVSLELNEPYKPEELPSIFDRPRLSELSIITETAPILTYTSELCENRESREGEPPRLPILRIKIHRHDSLSPHGPSSLPRTNGMLSKSALPNGSLSSATSLTSPFIWPSSSALSSGVGKRSRGRPARQPAIISPNVARSASFAGQPFSPGLHSPAIPSPLTLSVPKTAKTPLPSPLVTSSSINAAVPSTSSSAFPLLYSASVDSAAFSSRRPSITPAPVSVVKRSGRVSRPSVKLSPPLSSTASYVSTPYADEPFTPLHATRRSSTSTIASPAVPAVTPELKPAPAPPLPAKRVSIPTPKVVAAAAAAVAAPKPPPLATPKQSKPLQPINVNDSHQIDLLSTPKEKPLPTPNETAAPPVITTTPSTSGYHLPRRQHHAPKRFDDFEADLPPSLGGSTKKRRLSFGAGSVTNSAKRVRLSSSQRTDDSFVPPPPPTPKSASKANKRGLKRKLSAVKASPAAPVSAPRHSEPRLPPLRISFSRKSLPDLDGFKPLQRRQSLVLKFKRSELQAYETFEETTRAAQVKHLLNALISRVEEAESSEPMHDATDFDDSEDLTLQSSVTQEDHALGGIELDEDSNEETEVNSAHKIVSEVLQDLCEVVASLSDLVHNVTAIEDFG